MESGKEPLQVGKSLHVPNLTLWSLNYFTTINVRLPFFGCKLKSFFVQKSYLIVAIFLLYIQLSKYCPTNDNVLSFFLIMIRDAQTTILELHIILFYFCWGRFFFALFYQINKFQILIFS